MPPLSRAQMLAGLGPERGRAGRLLALERVLQTDRALPAA
jgi:hypothetical protein